MGMRCTCGIEKRLRDAAVNASSGVMGCSRRKRCASPLKSLARVYRLQRSCSKLSPYCCFISRSSAESELPKRSVEMSSGILFEGCSCQPMNTPSHSESLDGSWEACHMAWKSSPMVLAVPSTMAAVSGSFGTALMTAARIAPGFR